MSNEVEKAPCKHVYVDGAVACRLCGEWRWPKCPTCDGKGYKNCAADEKGKRCGEPVLGDLLVCYDHAVMGRDGEPANPPELTEGTATVTVNGEKKTVLIQPLSYEAVVVLAGEKGSPSVTWKLQIAGGGLSSGTMHPGSASIIPNDGLVFNVSHTGNA